MRQGQASTHTLIFQFERPVNDDDLLKSRTNGVCNIYHLDTYMYFIDEVLYRYIIA